MAQTTLEEITRLADQLSVEERRALAEHLLGRKEVTTLEERPEATPSITDRSPRSLYGIWEGHFPEDFDIDAALHEIRHEWEKEWPELFAP